MVRPVDFSVMKVTLSADDILEKRYAYSGNDLEYEGWSKIPNASTAAPVWYVVKYVYTAGDLSRQRLPDDGPFFKYVWDDRATLFA